MNDKKTRGLIINTYCKEFTNLPFNYANVRRKIVEFRIKANFKYENDYDIPQKTCVTKNDEKFLFFDSRKDNENIVIVFTIKRNMKHIGMNKTWVCGGTFKTAPKEFEQLFTIQCLIVGKYVPLYHCFMKKRDEASYKSVYDVLF
ncbi:hypothetical protein CDIK_3105 [Cucumispora dikerogammari]|nr:hypothetical protein CDIK_3105 [Cucumispora dikerogammari]